VRSGPPPDVITMALDNTGLHHLHGGLLWTLKVLPHLGDSFVSKN